MLHAATHFNVISKLHPLERNCIASADLCEDVDCGDDAACNMPDAPTYPHVPSALRAYTDLARLALLRPERPYARVIQRTTHPLALPSYHRTGTHAFVYVGTASGTS